ncbi:MAG: hypothetical protein M3292_04135 [Actinomycetota bacterium]|nr:hypothetical protein [Actinomycetota bacterium]
MSSEMGEDAAAPIEDIRTRIGDVKRNRPREAGEHPGHEHAVESVREDDYRGHHIVVRTRYSIEVDGRPVTGHLAVTNDGRVHYHAVPNLSFTSAVDLVRRLIDAFPDDFEGDGTGGSGDGGGH